MDEAAAPAAAPVSSDEHVVTGKIHDQRKELMGKFERRYGFGLGGKPPAGSYDRPQTTH